jgi:hypothetical protein
VFRSAAGGRGIGVLVSERSPAACQDTLIQVVGLVLVAFLFGYDGEPEIGEKGVWMAITEYPPPVPAILYRSNTRLSS